MKTQLVKFLSKFPNNAMSWKYATDEVRDLARWAKEHYNEQDLDVLEDEPNALQPLNFRELATPAAWNTEGKKYILDTFNKMSKNTKELYLSYIEDMIK